MDLNIGGRLALVTGSTQGIGRAIAGLLVAEGARVIVNGRDERRLNATVADLATRGEVHGIAADLSGADGARRLVEAATAIGAVDILVNNVGYFEVRAFEELTDQHWLEMFELNVMSGVRLARALLPGMLARDWGRIVFIGSDQSAKPNPGMAHYAMTKAAQVSVARSLAELTRGTRVTVNSALVAPTWSEGVEVFLSKLAARDGTSIEALRTAYFAEGPGTSSLLQRWAIPEEIAAQIAFLCSDQAAAINGAAQRVDGGIIRSLF
jgi:NAD(P)-dependent dehydrogenase (short-subunit alcohol dehydrogenase family)